MNRVTHLVIRIIAIVPFLAAGLATANPTSANIWPRLDNANSSVPCQKTLIMARDAFRSPHSSLSGQVVPIDNNDKSIFGLQNEGIPEADSNVFDTVDGPEESGPITLYWQRETVLPYRIFIKETPMGWKGSVYALYSIDRTIGRDEVLNTTDEEKTHPQAVEIIEPRWTAPLLLQNNASSLLWALDFGEPYQILPPWKVYSAEEPGMTLHCKVLFSPDDKKPRTLLPQPVQDLAGLLDQTVGSGKNDGSLQSTAETKIEIEQVWASAALRPWALHEPDINKVKADSRLKTWANKKQANQAIRQDILKQYPEAERALAGYYRTAFGKTADDAQQLAARALDVAFRSYFAT